MRVQAKFAVKTLYAAAEDSSHMAFLSVNLTLTRTSGAALWLDLSTTRMNDT